MWSPVPVPNYLGASVRADTGYHCSVGVGAHCRKQPVLSKYWLQLCCASGELLQVVSKHDSSQFLIYCWCQSQCQSPVSPRATGTWRQHSHGFVGPSLQTTSAFQSITGCQSRSIVEQHYCTWSPMWHTSQSSHTTHPKKHICFEFCDQIISYTWFQSVLGLSLGTARPGPGHESFWYFGFLRVLRFHQSALTKWSRKLCPAVRATWLHTTY